MEAVRQDASFLYQGNDSCPICLEDLDNRYVVAHEDQEGAGHLHSMHENCRGDLLKHLDKPPYTCPICRVPLAGNPITPIRELYDSTIQIFYDYPKDTLPKKILNNLQSRKIETLKKSLLYGLSLDCSCFIAASIFFYQARAPLLSILPFNPEPNEIILVCLVVQIRFLPGALSLHHLLTDRSYTERFSSTFALNREIAKAHKEEIRNAYIISFALGLILGIGASLYLTVPKEHFTGFFIEILTISIGIPLFAYKIFPTKT